MCSGCLKDVRDRDEARKKKLCPMCKEREVVVRGRCAECDAEMAKRWETIDRRNLNDVWLQGGCEAVEALKLDRVTCDACGTVNDESWQKCSGCGASAIEQFANRLDIDPPECP